MKSLCLTLFLFCQTTFNTFDFEYSNKKEKCPKGQRRDPSTGRCTPVGKY